MASPGIVTTLSRLSHIVNIFSDFRGHFNSGMPHTKQIQVILWPNGYVGYIVAY